MPSSTSVSGEPMPENRNHLRTLGPAPSVAVVLKKPETEKKPEPELPPEYFRDLLRPRCQRDGVCDDCGMCTH